MAESKPTATSLSREEIEALAGRMQARANSILSEAPSQHSDLMAAARLIRALIRAGAINEPVQLGD